MVQSLLSAEDRTGKRMVSPRREIEFGSNAKKVRTLSNDSIYNGRPGRLLLWDTRAK